MKNRYTSVRIISEKIIRVIVDDNGKIVNRSPSKDELKGLEEEPYHRNKILKKYNETNTCDNIRENGKKCENKLNHDTTLREYKERKWTGKWFCRECHNLCYQRNNAKGSNALKLVGDRRTGNLRHDSSQSIGDKGEELLCIWKNFINLNKKDDDYNSHIDCLDDDTREHYQVKIARYNLRDGRWSFDLRNIHRAAKERFRFKCLFLFCISEEGKIIERVYEIPEKEIIYEISEKVKGRTGISIQKNPSRGGQWYEEYRIKDSGELKKVNNIWEELLEEGKKRK